MFASSALSMPSHPESGILHDSNEVHNQFLSISVLNFLRRGYYDTTARTEAIQTNVVSK